MQDNYGEAIRAYEMVLQQPDLPLGMETTTMYSLCTLYFQQERYEDSLAMLDRWFGIAEDPGPEPYVLRAQQLFSLQRFEEGIEPITTAIRLNQELQREPQEPWYQLLNVLLLRVGGVPQRHQGAPGNDRVVAKAGIFRPALGHVWTARRRQRAVGSLPGRA